MDSILVFPPGASGVTGVGSAIQLGSWLNAAEANDPYGAAGLIQSMQAQNALRDGGVFAFRHAPVRHMAIPLIINTPSVVQWEAMLARYTTPGAYIAVQPEGIPSSQAVYFDVIDGRWEPAYNTFENRAHVRRGTLHLDTQPYGYWPTEILLASAASIGFFGVLAVNCAASLIGDVPPLARVQVSATVASAYVGAAKPDMIGITFGGRPSFVPYISPASCLAATMQSAVNVTVYRLVPTLAGDQYAPASQALVWSSPGPSNGGAQAWQMAVHTSSFISSALEPAYRGRFRLFTLWKTTPSSAPYFSFADAERAAIGSVFAAMASGNQLATVYNNVPSARLDGLVFFASPGFNMHDMGEITLPPGGASGVQGPVRLRCWLNGSVPTGTVPTLTFGGFYLFPLDGAAGILTKGAFVPSLSGGDTNTGAQGTVAALDINTNFVEGVNLTAGLTGPGVQPVMYQDGRSYWRGNTIRLGASVSQLQIVTGDRLTLSPAATYPVGQMNLEFSQVSVSYRPTFQFLYGI